MMESNIFFLVRLFLHLIITAYIQKWSEGKWSEWKYQLINNKKSLYEK